MAYTTINKSSDYFNTKLYTGTGSSNAITGIGFAPDWLWLKARNTSTSNQLVDNVRGATKMLASDNNSAEFTAADRVASLDSDGMTLGTNSNTNGSGTPYISWLWKANGQGSSNTDGTINTTYTSANTTSGFSISQYTGTGSAATIGHGLGVTPKMIIVKRTNTTGGWTIYHSSVGNTKYLYLNTTDAEATASSIWNNTSPTSSLFTVGTDGEVNGSGSTYVAYCFAEKIGFSKFGLYDGNGNADGTFVYTGFKPSWVMIKRYDSGTLDWNMYDNKRLGYNGGDAPLFANLSNAESNDYGRIDLVSNGFKIRTSNDQLANNGGSFLYMAFAEAPLVTSGNIPATAR